jgi:radical SAM-linked protein
MIVVFEKGYALRHIGHLDLMRTVQRALRCTSLPIRYSKGFSPHIQLSFAAPLSVGVVGARELMDVPMEAEVTGNAFAAAMNKVLPQSLCVLAARPVADDFPTLMALVAGSRIRMDIEGGSAADEVAGAFPRFMADEACVTLRKTKAGENMTNIRPFIVEATMAKTGAGYTLRALIENRREGSLKPAVLMQALCELAGVESVPYIATREEILARQDGALIRLEEYAHG